MFKKLFVCSLLLPAFMNGMVYLPKGVTAADVCKAAANKKIIFAWDIHGVLVKKDKTTKLKTVIKNLPTIGFSKLGKNKAWQEIEKLSKTLDISGEGYYEIFLKYNQPKLAKMIAEAANGYKPRKGMPSLVHELNLLGYTQRYASNIGQKFQKNLTDKCKKKYKISMLDMILPGKMPDYSQFGKKPLPKPLPKDLASMPKPHSQFFKEFIDTYNSQEDCFVIFIDDKLDNTQSAINTNSSFVGIHMNANWDDKTFVKQLRNAFQSLGIYGNK